MNRRRCGSKRSASQLFLRPGVALARPSAFDRLWLGDDLLGVRRPLPGRVVVHGHTICRLPQSRDHRINLDTDAFAKGRLTGLVRRGNQRRFLATGEEADIG